MRSPVRRCAAFLLALGALFLEYSLVLRPWFLNWGSLPEERRGYLPGDEFLPTAGAGNTRAVTIQAPSTRVWSWLTQIGQDRGGFYSYQLLENVAGCEMPRVEHLDPMLQQWRAGDALWMYPSRKFGGVGQATLLHIDPGRALIFGTRQIGTSLTSPPDGTWSFILEPAGKNQTRFLVRGRVTGGGALGTRIFMGAFFDPVHYIMERKMMLGIKDRAEGRPPSIVKDHAHVGLWALTLVLFVLSSAMTLRIKKPQVGVRLVLLSGLIFQLLTLLQPSLWIGIPVVLALIGFIFLAPVMLYARPRLDQRA